MSNNPSMGREELRVLTADPMTALAVSDWIGDDAVPTIDDLPEEHAELKNVVRSLSGDSEILHRQVNDLAKSFELMKNSLAPRADEVAPKPIANLKATTRTSNDVNIKDLIDQVNSWRNRAFTAEGQLSTVSDTVEMLINQRDAAMAENAKLTERLAKAEFDRDSALHTAETYGLMVDDLHVSMAKLTKKLERLEKTSIEASDMPTMGRYPLTAKDVDALNGRVKAIDDRLTTIEVRYDSHLMQMHDLDGDTDLEGGVASKLPTGRGPRPTSSVKLAIPAPETDWIVSTLPVSSDAEYEMLLRDMAAVD
jgi:regulator of replication initiation timing